MPDYTILLIDYDPRSISRVRNALEGVGYHVEVAKDGEAGIKAFEEIRPDLTLVEAMIPKVHGFEVCRRLKQTSHGKDSPVLIITAVYKGRRHRFEARYQYRCDGYLEKPISDDELVAAVSSCLSMVGKAAKTSTAAPSKAIPDAGPSTGAKPEA